MYRHSPVRNPRSRGIKIKNVLQVCLLLAVCFWLIFQVKRSHDKKKEFDATDKRIPSSEEIVKFGRKDLPPKLDQTVKEVERHENEHEQQEEEDNKHDEEEVEEDKIDDEKDDVIDENDQQKSDVEIDREEVDIIDEDKEIEESGSDKENEEKEEETQTDNTVDHDEEHTHELREEHYKADDASSAVTHDGPTENEIKNGTLDNSSENVGQIPKNETFSNIQENESEPVVSSVNPASSVDFLENGPPSNTTVITSDSSQDQKVTAIEQVSDSTYVSENSGSNETKVETDEGDGENLETNNVIEGTETLDPDEVQNLEEIEVRTDLDTLPEIETEGVNSEDTAAE